MKRKFTGWGGKQSRQVIRYKKTNYYPMIYCEHEKLPIGISNIKCERNVKVNWRQWTDDRAEWLEGYKIDLVKSGIGDEVKCPVCGNKVDFRFWPSDTTPHIVQKVKVIPDDKNIDPKELAKPQVADGGTGQGN